MGKNLRLAEAVGRFALPGNGAAVAGLLVRVLDAAADVDDGQLAEKIVGVTRDVLDVVDRLPGDVGATWGRLEEAERDAMLDAVATWCLATLRLRRTVQRLRGQRPRG